MIPAPVIQSLARRGLRIEYAFGRFFIVQDKPGVPRRYAGKRLEWFDRPQRIGADAMFATDAQAVAAAMGIAGD